MAKPADGAVAELWDGVVTAYRRVLVHSARLLRSVAARLGPTREQESAPAGGGSELDSDGESEDGPGEQAPREEHGGERSV